jgi:DNA-binding transcriptional LysR family regulator
MDLRQLRYVLAVVDHGGFTRAAAAIPVAQPSLSQAVRSLEAELGVELFHRTGRRVVLTAAGEAFVDGARQVERDMATLRAGVEAVRGVVAGRLDLAALPTLAVTPLADVIGRFRRAHPGVAIVVNEPEDPAAAAHAVARGAVELALTELPPPRPGLESVSLGRQELVAVLPPGTAVASRVSLTIETLASHPLVITPPATSSRRVVDEAFARAGVEPRIAVEVSHREALLPLVLAGAGACVLPAALARGAGRRAVVRRLRPALAREIGLVHRPGPLSPAARALVELARARSLPTGR